MTTLADIEAQLTAPGAPFALTREVVLGHEVEVFAQRARSLRELLVRSAAYGDVEYLVFPQRRLTFATHAREVDACGSMVVEYRALKSGHRAAKR